MNIKDAYIHNGVGVLKDIQVTAAGMLQKQLAAKTDQDVYEAFTDVYNLTNIKPTAAGTADKVAHALTFSGGVTGNWDGSADKTVAIPTKASWNYDDVYLKLSGGTLTGNVIVDDEKSFKFIQNRSAGGWAWAPIVFTREYGEESNDFFWIGAFGNENGASDYSYAYLGMNAEYNSVNNLRLYQNSVKFGNNVIYHAGNLSIGTLMGSTAIGDSDEPVYWSGTAFVKANAYPTKASWNYDDVYVKLTGNSEITGVITIAPTNTSAQQEGLVLHDRGSGGSEALWIKWSSASYTDGVKLRGLPDEKTLQFYDDTSWRTVYHSGNLSIGTLMGSSAIGDSDEPVYWSGSAFVKAGAYPTKSSWNYDDVYLKDVGLDTGNSTDKNKSTNLTNSNVYLKLFKTVNSAESEDSKVKIYGETNISVTTDASGDIKITGVDSVSSATNATYAANVGVAGTAGTNYVTAANVISMYTWYSTITATDEAANTAIDKWQEIIDFLAGTTDTSTLSGLLSGKANSTHYHSYTDLRGSTATADQAIVSSGTADGWTLKTLGARAFDSTAYLPLTGGTITSTSTNPLIINNDKDFNYVKFGTSTGQKGEIGYYHNGPGSVGMMYMQVYGPNNTYPTFGLSTDGNGYIGSSKIWHAGNDGSTSGLDADLLDGYEASAFALSGHTHSEYIPKTTWDWYYEVSGNGAWCLGKFCIYDSTIIISIKAGNGVNNVGTLVINSWNKGTNNGQVTAYVHGDCNNDLTDRIKIYNHSNPDSLVEVYYSGPNYTKMFVHIQANNLVCRTDMGGPNYNTLYSDIGTKVNSIPASATLVPTNMLLTSTSTFALDTTGNAATASKWATARTLSLTGSVTGSVSIDGSGDVTLSTSTNHTHNYLFSEQKTFPQDSTSGDSPVSWAETYAEEKIRAYTYNSYGAEFSYLIGMNTNKNYGTILKIGYSDKYLRILRKNSGSWQSDDWEKISAGYADSAGDASTLGGYSATGLPYIQKLAWWNEGDSHNVNDRVSGVGFAYTTHGAPTNGVLAAFTGTHDSYTLQLQGQYNGENLYFRNKNGDNNTWNTWRYVIHSGNISTQSVAYADNSGTVGGKAASDFVPKKDSTSYYPFIKSNHGGVWYKVTLAHRDNTNNSNYKWFMITMQINLGGSYSNGPNGKIFLCYYFDRRQNNGEYIAQQVCGIGIGRKLTYNTVQIKYDIADPAIFYLYAAGSGYNAMSIDNLTAKDNAPAYNFLETTIETISACPAEANKSVPLAFVETNDGSDLYFNGNTILHSGNYSNYSIAWSQLTGAPALWDIVAKTAVSYSVSNAGWTDTITLPTDAGSYVLTLISGNSTLTGVFSIGSSDNTKDEISLHLHGNGPRLYARTSGTKLQISSNDATAQSRSVVIKYKRLT